MATLGQIAKFLGAELSGDASLEVLRVSSFERASADSIVFSASESALSRAISSNAAAVITDLPGGTTKPSLLVKDPKLAFARVAKFLQLQAEVENVAESPPNVHPTAVLGHGVVLGKSVRIGAGCVIGDGVNIGAHCRIYPRVVIYSGCTLGGGVTVHAGAVLGSDGFGYVRDAETGEHVGFPQQGTLVIEDEVDIGANSTIDRGALGETRIGRGTKIDNLVHIAHNVTIGRNVVIAAQTGISGSCVIGDGAVLGGQVGIGDHATIGDGVILGGGSGVLSNKSVMGPGQVFWGTPARPLHRYLRELATIARLARRKISSAPPDE